jgi:hypothetical protein
VGHACTERAVTAMILVKFHSNVMGKAVEYEGVTYISVVIKLGIVVLKAVKTD